MSMTKRGRGRPRGTGKDDSKLLAAVADMIAADPTLRPTTALREIWRDATDADRRRFQAKWKVDREQLLGEARIRLEKQPVLEVATGHDEFAARWQGVDICGLAELVREMECRVREAKGTIEMVASSVRQPICDFTNSLKAICGVNIQIPHAVGDLDGPVMRAMREQQEFANHLSSSFRSSAVAFGNTGMGQTAAAAVNRLGRSAPPLDSCG